MKGKSDIPAAFLAFCICLVIFPLAFVKPASGRDIAGVAVPESVTIKNKALVLNGAGIRRKFIIKVYVGSLYLTVKRSSVEGILDDPGAKRIAMNFLYKEVSADTLVEGWNKGFAENNSSQELLPLQDRIRKFNSFFTTVRKGDEIRLDYLPGEGTQVWINEALKGYVSGEDFSRALLKIWLGPNPPDSDLKDAMLGNSY
jgi:hypothetical protein